MTEPDRSPREKDEIVQVHLDVVHLNWFLTLFWFTLYHIHLDQNSVYAMCIQGHSFSRDLSFRRKWAIYKVISCILKLKWSLTPGRTHLKSNLACAVSSISCTSSLWAARTRAQTITVIMENHVLLWRNRPADWLTAGVPEGLMYKQQRDTEAGGGRKNTLGNKKEKDSPLIPSPRRVISVYILPLSGRFTIPLLPCPTDVIPSLLVRHSPPWRSSEWYVPWLQTVLWRYWLQL